mgnify:CR=1 FL=1
MIKYVVTGAAGFIGSTLCQSLLRNDQNCMVYGIDNLNDAYDRNIKHWRLSELKQMEKFRFVEEDISKENSKWTNVFENADVVFHLAARAGVIASVKKPREYVHANIHGSLNLLEACKKYSVDRVIMASTSSVYGASKELPFKESGESSLTLSPYAATKKGAEALMFTYHYLYGMNVQVMRFFTVYGPAGRPDMSIFKFTKSIFEGEELTLYGDGGERDFTYVNDVVSGLQKSAHINGFNIINLGSDRPVRITKIIELIEKYVGRSASIKVIERDPSDISSTWADITVARRLLNWEPSTTIEDGLLNTVEWYRENREWLSRIEVG